LGCLHIDACVGAIYVSDEFWLQRVLHQHADWILAHETFEIGDNPYLEGCVQNVLTSPDTPQFAKFQTRSGRMSSIAVLTTHSAPDPEQVRTDAPADNGSRDSRVVDREQRNRRDEAMSPKAVGRAVPQADRLPCTLTALGGCERSPSGMPTVHASMHIWRTASDSGVTSSRSTSSKSSNDPITSRCPSRSGFIAADMVTAPHSTG
jgi:hypothetical protein